MMNERRKRFAIAYVDTGNIVEAAEVAGYSKNYAEKQAYKLLGDADVKAFVDELLEEIKSKKIAKAEEVLEYLTAVMRGKSESEIVVVEGDGLGCSSAAKINKAPDEKERLKAAELLGKRYRLFADKVEVEGAVPVIITGGDQLEE